MLLFTIAHQNSKFHSQLTIMFGNVFKLFRRIFKLIFYQLNHLSLCEFIVLSSHAHSIYYTIYCVEGRTMVITLLYA